VLTARHRRSLAAGTPLVAGAPPPPRARAPAPARSRLRALGLACAAVRAVVARSPPARRSLPVRPRPHVLAPLPPRARAVVRSGSLAPALPVRCSPPWFLHSLDPRTPPADARRLLDRLEPWLGSASTAALLDLGHRCL